MIDGLALANTFSENMRRLGPFECSPKIAVALSGGSDSMCLTLLLKKWTIQHGGKLVALTVDHGLRSESRQEAACVTQWMKHQEIEHHILPWEGIKPLSKIQEYARAARYNLLENWCNTHGILHLCLGHNLEDQVETALFRLCRGSGLDGCAGMSAIIEKPTLRILRPILNVSRETIKQVLELNKQQWIEDPTNTNSKYTRNRLRKLQGLLGQEGLSTQRAFGFAKKQGQARLALEIATNEFIAKNIALYPEGYAFLKKDQLCNTPGDILLRSLAWILMSISGQDFPPRHKNLEYLHSQLVSDSITTSRTCGGCLISVRKHGILFAREDGLISDTMQFHKDLTTIWDRRFTISVRWPKIADSKPAPLSIAKLGEKGWKQVVSHLPTLLKKRLPAHAAYALPAIWEQETVWLVPLLAIDIPPEEGRNVLPKVEVLSVRKQPVSHPEFKIT